MKIARIAAEGSESWAQSFVSARPKREVGMSNERISRLIEAALSGSKHKASGSAGGYLLGHDPRLGPPRTPGKPNTG